MTDGSLIDTFTLDEEIEEWIVGDDSVEITGFVDSIEGTKMVTPLTGLSSKQVALFKIIVNNGSTMRVRILFWGTLAAEYSPKIVITIVRAKTIKPNPRYVNPQDNLFSLELTILPSSVITISENKYKDPTFSREVRTVALKNLEGLEEIVYVYGYLKQEFGSVTTFGSTYGRGVVVDEDIRLPVKIANYAKPANFPKGSHLTMLGKANTPLNGPTQFLVAFVDDITINTALTTLTPDKLRKLGVRPPKRKSEELMDTQNLKK
ncbi:uncharacterized protein LOC141526496 [Cotesia typhae]|uniref:uncharacterized protein LOC141526496 n=1 Tax=Cotesia typhae TaxID=2053667 RepID=UPI003D697276